MDEIVLKIITLKEKIIGEINTSDLPAIMLKPIFEDIVEQLKKIELEQSSQVKSDKSIQEKQKQIEELQKQIEELKGGKE